MNARSPQSSVSDSPGNHPSNHAGDRPSAPVSPQHTWRTERAIRGITLGPIENALHPGKGYGSAACGRQMELLARQGATWVSLTPFGRVADLAPTGIDWTFEAPFQQNRADVLRAIAQAHDYGLKVLLVPHLWVESGGWRALIEPGSSPSDAVPGADRWARWSRAYEAYVEAWAHIAQDGGVDMMSLGAELRSWVTSAHAVHFDELIRGVRRIYRGPLTYSANWDDVDDTIILGKLDVIGINAFYPLTDHAGATLSELAQGGAAVAVRVRELSQRWQRPVIFTEAGYTTRTDPALRPWEWPDGMKGIEVDERAQAEAFLGLLAPLADEGTFGGWFLWRQYADPDDVSQEAAWGFSTRGKLAELIVRDLFAGHWRGDADFPIAPALGVFAAESLGVY